MNPLQEHTLSPLQGKIALITGGNSGIGYATAKILKGLGASVIITGRRQEAVRDAAGELGLTGIVADQSSLADTERLAGEIKERFGRVDILFINAGIVGGLFPIEAATEKQLDETMGINFRGAYFTLSRFIPLLPEGASVIFLSSIVARMSSAGSSIYSASKAALNSIMKTAAVELAPRKIRVNAVSPGPIHTNVLSKIGIDEETLARIKKGLTAKIPVGRMGSSEEVGRLVAYLAGEGSGFITGSEFTIDGGLTLQ